MHLVEEIKGKKIMEMIKRDKMTHNGGIYMVTWVEDIYCDNLTSVTALNDEAPL